ASKIDSTRVSALSVTAIVVGTPGAEVMPGTGTATTSWGPEPESGATGTTSALNSSTSRVPEGDGQVRMPVSTTPVEEGSPWALAAPGPRAVAGRPSGETRAPMRAGARVGGGRPLRSWSLPVSL